MTVQDLLEVLDRGADLIIYDRSDEIIWTGDWGEDDFDDALYSRQVTSISTTSVWCDIAIVID